MQKYIVCPNCKNTLIKKKKKYHCSTCKNTFESIKNIPSFVDRDDKYFKDFNAGKPPGKYRLDDVRLIIDFLDKNFGLKGKKVLDLGCGWGDISVSLFKKGSEVTGVDIIFKRLEYLKKHSKGIDIFHADAEKLPFKGETFDFVIMRGVLEWVAEDKDGDVLKIQMRVLKEVNRVLKKNGVLYLGIENPIGLKLIFGKKENHTGLRFVTLMPKKIANLYSNLLRNKDFRNYTYPEHRLKKMFIKSGFKPKFYTPIPNYEFPDIHAELKKDEIIDALSELPHLKHSRYRGLMGKLVSKIAILLTKIGLYEKLVLNYVVVARKK